jgi:hypothetical protein
MSNQDPFFSSKNEAMLDRLLYTDIQRRAGTDLSDKQKERLLRTVRHYMKEVNSKNPGEAIQNKNKEVLTAVVPDYMSYLRRSAGPVMDDGDATQGLEQDVNTRFGQLQAARQEGRAAVPSAPDFRISLDEDGPASVARFEELKKLREAEAARDVATAAAMIMKTNDASISRGDASIARIMDADADFSAGAAAARVRDDEQLQARALSRAAARSQNEIIGVPPDPRRLLLGDGQERLGPRGSLAQANPTYALPDSIRDRPVLPQDMIKPQSDILAYRENEYNLFIYSADRDWVNNNTESRYNFSINFDPANNRPGFGFSTATNIKFKNITRIEFVKAIMPTEACDTLTISSAAAASSGNEPTMNTNLNMNVFSYPYLQVRIPELDTNGFGTNDGINNAFAAISYDAYWTADSSANNRGYARMIPKFLKCQKVFYPTPLATLQKLSFQIQKPDGNLVCSSMDTIDISGIYISSSATVTSKYYDNSGMFIWLNLKTYFNKFAFTQGDRIQLKNLDFSSTFKTAAGSVATTDLINFLTRAEGHLISDIGQMNKVSGSLVYRDGANVVGYANSIIIRGNFNDPTTGSTALKYWGGTSSTNTAFLSQLASTPAVSTGRLIYLNHQIQIIMRVITRDMDSASRLRPDNLQA